jgi:hypothetical protein
MQTPVWSSMPLPKAALRTVDLFPSMLHWLGVRIPANLDGELVWLPQRPQMPIPQRQVALVD